MTQSIKILALYLLVSHCFSLESNVELSDTTNIKKIILHSLANKKFDAQAAYNQHIPCSSHCFLTIHPKNNDSEHVEVIAHITHHTDIINDPLDTKGYTQLQALTQLRNERDIAIKFDPAIHTYVHLSQPIVPDDFGGNLSLERHRRHVLYNIALGALKTTTFNELVAYLQKKILEDNKNHSLELPYLEQQITRIGQLVTSSNQSSSVESLKEEFITLLKDIAHERCDARKETNPELISEIKALQCSLSQIVNGLQYMLDDTSVNTVNLPSEAFNAMTCPSALRVMAIEKLIFSFISAPKAQDSALLVNNVSVNIEEQKKLSEGPFVFSPNIQTIELLKLPLFNKIANNSFNKSFGATYEEYVARRSQQLDYQILNALKTHDTCNNDVTIVSKSSENCPTVTVRVAFTITKEELEQYKNNVHNN